MFEAGKGRYTCIDGRKYYGQWRHGKRSGQGDMILCPVGHRGDHNRRFIGGLCGLYRAIKYSGTWNDNWRIGQGRLEMIDGMTVDAEFVDGLADGLASVMYSDGTKRTALFEFGKRAAWTDKSTSGLGTCWVDIGIDRQFFKLIGKDLAWIRAAARVRRQQIERGNSREN